MPAGTGGGRNIHHGNYRPSWLAKKIGANNTAKKARSHSKVTSDTKTLNGKSAVSEKPEKTSAGTGNRKPTRTWGTRSVGYGRVRSSNYENLTGAGEALHTSVVELFEHVIDNTNTIVNNEQWQPPRFRGSDLPFCGLRYALDYALKTGDVETTMKTFHTSTGHAIHETLQEWLGRATLKTRKRKSPKACQESGVFLGKYVCPVCGTMYPKNSKPDDNKVMLGPVVCSSRKHKLKKYLGKEADIPCRYYEINLNGLKHTAGFTGHCDGVILINGKYLILEAKTTSLFSMQKKAKEGPYKAHVLQSTAYRYLMPKFLGLADDMFHDYMAVVYFYKGNITKNVVCLVPYKPKLFLDQIPLVLKAKKAVKEQDHSACSRMGICESREDAGFCRHANKCFGSSSPRKYIMHCLTHGEEPE